jgi:hypothetical protein
MKLTLISLTLLTIFLSPRVALACSCFGNPSICGSFASAEAVLVGTVSRVEITNVKTPDGEEYGNQIAYVQVEESFKGVKASEMIFRSYGTSCDPDYQAGQRWLFYAYFNKDDKAWVIHACDRSTLIDSAPDDLSYLRNLPGSAQKSHFSGVLRKNFHTPLMGTKVKVTNGRKVYETFTDKNGVYELPGLPPGTYSVEPEVPSTLKLTFASQVGKINLRDGPRVVLEERSCAGISFYYSENTSVSGKLFGADGLPVKNVCVRLRSKDNPNNREYLTSCTEPDGSFKIDEIPLGDYFLLVNEENKITSSEPFPTVYFPGVFEKEKATVLTIATGDQREDLDIHIPLQQATKTIAGKFLYSDGRPVVNESVKFEEEPRGSEQGASASGLTDADGRFSLQVLEGLKGSLRGYIITYRGQYANCPKLERLIKTKELTMADIETNVIKLEMNTDYRDLELKFPFPYCAKAKSPQ